MFKYLDKALYEIIMSEKIHIIVIRLVSDQTMEKQISVRCYWFGLK